MRSVAALLATMLGEVPWRTSPVKLPLVMVLTPGEDSSRGFQPLEASPPLGTTFGSGISVPETLSPGATTIPPADSGATAGREAAL